jgi:hypothetical protein
LIRLLRLRKTKKRDDLRRECTTVRYVRNTRKVQNVLNCHDVHMHFAKYPSIEALTQECLRNYYGMCISEGLVSQVICIDSTCSKTLSKPPDPKTKEDHALLPCTPWLARLTKSSLHSPSSLQYYRTSFPQK